MLFLLGCEFLTQEYLYLLTCNVDCEERLKELCVGSFKIQSLGKGKYGRILAIPYTENSEDICQILKDEGHAVEYWGGTKKAKVRDDGTWGE